jgi:hypothetical protein
MPRRKLLAKPTPKMRDKAILALAEVVADPGAPVHARVSAAKTLYGKPDEDNTPPEELPSPTVIWLPAQGRNPELEKLGFNGNPQQSVVFFDSKTEAGLADRDRWMAEHSARVAAFNGAPLSIAQRRAAKLLGAPGHQPLGSR